jgi:Caspase domain
MRYTPCKHLFSALMVTFAILLILGCSSTRMVKVAPPFKVMESSLSRDMEDKGIQSVPIGRSASYSQDDTEIVSSIRMANVSGKHKVRWDWYRPDGKLYISSDNQRLEIESGKYHEEINIWHKLSLHGEPASQYPGRWLVNICFDNDIIYSSHFEIKPEINIDIVPKYAQKSNPSNWGLIIGVENYSSLPDVRFAQKDAQLVKKYFERILGVPRENIISLINADATKGKIEGLLRKYLPMNVDRDTTLYVYFAGHGMPSIKEGDAFLCTYAADPRFIEHTGYKLETLYKDLDALSINKAIVFIDSCFSGASSRGSQLLLTGARPALLKVDSIKMPSDRTIAMAASENDQVSSSYPEKKHGLFTYFLLKGLRGPADADNDKNITLNELFAYVNTNVSKVSRRKGIEQSPVIMPTFDSLKDIEISRVIDK